MFAILPDGNADLTQSSIHSNVNLAFQDLHTATRLANNCSRGRIAPNQCCDSQEHLISANGLASDQHGPKVVIEQQRGLTEDIAQEDPFGLNPIIRRITKEAKLKSKRAHAGRNISKAHNSTKSPHNNRNTGTLNKNGNRRASSIDTTENTQGQKRRCLPSVSSSSLLRSAGVGVAQPRQAP